MYSEFQFEQLEFCFHGFGNSDDEPCYCSLLRPCHRGCAEISLTLLHHELLRSGSPACFLETSKDSQGLCLVNVLLYKAHTFLYFCY